MTAQNVIGFDVPIVENWMADSTLLTPPCEWRRLEGGHSNLTYELTDMTGAQFVIRRPPLGELLPKAHDMLREFRVIEALHPIGIPVAEPMGYCDDPSVCDRHFYVMVKVTGAALYTAAETAPRLDGVARARVGKSFIRVLAALHSVNPDEVGLGDLGRHEGYVARQLKTWHGSWTDSAEYAEYDDVRVHALHDRLLAEIPEQMPGRVVHGDYGVHNVMIDDDGLVSAVLDWEIATLGDPLADFAYALNAWVEPDDVPAGETSPTALPGFASREDLVRWYYEHTGADLSRLPYYRAFNSFKTACILHGVYARYRKGMKSTAGVDVEGLFQRMLTSIETAETHLAD